MPNENNIKAVKNLEQKIKDSSAMYFTKYTGMNVAQATQLRKSFKENSVEYIVSKNTLTKIAATNAGFDESKINEFLVGQIGIAYADSDPTAPAKVIKDFIKEKNNIPIYRLKSYLKRFLPISMLNFVHTMLSLKKF